MLFAGVACGGKDEQRDSEAAQPFYMEAEVVVVSRATTVGTNLPPADETTTTAIRWWSRDVRHARWELGRYTGVLDGERFWSYDPEANTYMVGDIPPLPDGLVAYSLPMSLLIGPTSTPDLDGFIAEMLTRVDTVERVGPDKVLGRDVTVVEARPAGTSTRDSGTGTPVVRSHGSIRYWVDEERMFVMRVELRDETQDADAIVTRLNYPAEIDDSVLEFIPPPGATEATP